MSVLVVALVATGVVGLAAGVEGAGRGAIADSVVADRGYAAGWVLQGPPGVAPALARVHSVVPVVGGQGSVDVPGRRAVARLRVLGNAKAPVGAVVAGRRVRRPREVTVSRALAVALGIHVGATVRVALSGAPGRSLGATVVGLTVNTAERSALEATLLDPGLLGRSPDYWLASGADSDAIGAIQGGLQAASTQTAIVDRLAHLPGAIAALGQLVPALGLVLLVFVISALAPQLSWARRDVVALQAAGATRRDAWRVIRMAAALALVVGGTAGACVGTLLLRWLREPLAAHFDQVWLHVPVPVTTPAVMILVLVLGCLLPFGALGTLASWAKVPASVRGSRLGTVLMLTLAACGMGALALAVAAMHGHTHVRSPWPLGMFGIVALVVAVRLLTDAVASAGLRPGTRALLGHLGTQGSLGFVVAAVLATASAGYVALTTADANGAMTAGAATQRPGSLLVSGAPTRAADDVLTLYRQRGGHHAFVYDIPDERTHVVRVTTARMAACLADHDLMACGGRTGDPMDVVMLDRHLHGNAARASQGVTGRTQPWAVTIDPTTSTVTDRREVTAVPDARLGENLPGLVVAADGPLGARPAAHAVWGRRVRHRRLRGAAATDAGRAPLDRADHCPRGPGQRHHRRVPGTGP